MKGEPINADRELIAQGVGNIIIPFFGGVPATAAIARTSVAIKAGQQTRLTGIIHSLGLLASMFLLSGIMSQIPMAALAGVLMVTAWRMNEWHTIKYLLSHKLKSAFLAFLVTLACTVLFDLSVAILAGVALCCILFAVKCVNNVEVTISEVDPLRLEKLNQKYHERHAAVRVVYISGSIFFGSAGILSQKLDEIPADMEAVVLSVRGVSTVDATGIQALLKYCEDQKAKGVTVCFAGASYGFRMAMDRGGVTAVVGEEAFYWGAQEALAAIAEAA
jgi:SulP family sulfate permease